MFSVILKTISPQPIGVSRMGIAQSLILMIAILAWLGDRSVLRALAAYSSEAPYSSAFQPSVHTFPQPDPDLPEPVDHPTAVSASPTEASWLILPDLRTLPPYDLKIVRLANGSRELRLSNTIWNSGAGPLELEGETNPTTRQTKVEQHIYTQTDTKLDHTVGEFIWHPGHDHWHFEEFSLYELWTLTPTGGLDKLVSSSDKVSYCVIDTDVIDTEQEGFSPRKRYYGCGKVLQGLSVGWGDTYKSFLDGQSIILSDIEDGFFALKSTANPDAILLESNYRNNAALIYLEIQGEEIEVINPIEYIERHCVENKGSNVQDLYCRV